MFTIIYGQFGSGKGDLAGRTLAVGGCTEEGE